MRVPAEGSGVRPGPWKRIWPPDFARGGFSLGTCCTAQFSRNRKTIVPVAEVILDRGSLMEQQDRWWLAISIVWVFVSMGVLLYIGLA